MPVQLLVALVFAAVVVLLVTRRRAPADGDYEARLEMMRRRSHDGVDRAASRKERDASEPASDPEAGSPAKLSYAPVGAPPIEHLELEDPLFGRLTFVDDEDGSRWEAPTGTALGIPGWVIVDSGPDGPGDLERACLEALAAQHADILADAIEIARRGLDLHHWRCEEIAPHSLRVGRQTPLDRTARGTIYMAVDGGCDGRVGVTTADNWNTLEAVIDS